MTIKNIITSSSKKFSTTFMNNASNIYNLKREQKIKIISLFIIISLIVAVIFYINNKIGLYKSNCNLLKKVYTTIPRLSSLSSDTEYLLRDYYIKTAYNCCASGQFKNDYVGLCALRTCINQGVRCLDFEIYSIDDQPVIAASSINDFTVKQTYNSIPTADAFKTILNLAFSTAHCPNAFDPLILHFRILSKNTIMYNNLANQISSLLNSRVLGVTYSFENDGKNLGALPIKNFLGKIVIIVDATNPIFQKTKLDEYVNASSGSPFFRSMTYQQLKFTQDLTLTSFNKKNMSIVMPDWSADDTNLNFNIAREYGCQFIAMSFQNYDSNLEHYNAFFDGNRSAFVLKPSNLRFTPLTIEVPPPSPPAYSFQSRSISSDFYNYRI